MKSNKTRTMKYNKAFIFSALIAMVMTSCGETKNKQEARINTQNEIEQKEKHTADIADASFSDGMTGKVFHNYQQIRMALVNSDAEGVQTAATNLAESFSEERENIKSKALAMAEDANLESQRQLFSNLTQEIEPLIKESLSGGKVYKQFCPMALDGKGAYWISNVEKIENPYYGSKMLKCGKVTETIEK
ncbi:DUF3347 domain-containing protein [Arenibacter aquaticus]|nr:DUF3347 domain-containing protein [Arenibacter aquaticus]